MYPRINLSFIMILRYNPIIKSELALNDKASLLSWMEPAS